MKKIILSENQIQQIIQLYNDNISTRKMSKIMGVSRRVIDRILIENNVPKRKPMTTRKYFFNEEYFDIIDTPNKAYIFGFLLADGNNQTTNRHAVTIELQERDDQLLKDIQRELELNRPLFYREKILNDKKFKSCLLTISSKHMSDRLNDLGMIPNKSLVLDFPLWITEELFPFMLKGYIDGDGTVDAHYITFVSSDKFCYGVQKYLFEHYNIESHIRNMNNNNEHTKIVSISHRNNLIALTKLMFAQPTLGLKRKVEKYYKYGFLNDNTNNSLSA